MTTARKTLYAAIGAGEVALEKVRDLPERAKSLPANVTSRVSGITVTNVRELPKSVKSFGTVLPAKATELVVESRRRATDVYIDLTERGEKLYKSVRRSAPTKRAEEQTKQARTRVKTAAKSVRKAASANAEAVASAVEKVTEATA